MKGWRFCCCVWFLGIALDGDTDSDDLVMLDVMNEVGVELGEHWWRAFCSSILSNVSSVSDPWQHVAAVSHAVKYEYSDRGSVWVRSYTADAFEVACRDVGRPFS